MSGDQDKAFWVKEVQRRGVDLQAATARREPASRINELRGLLEEAEERRTAL